MPLLFTFSEYLQADKSLCDLPGLKPGQFSIVRYDNQELRVTIQSRVTGDHCFIIGSVTPPECQMVSFLLLAHTLKKEGATRVTGILPYLAYSREDKLNPGQSLATAWTGAVLKASGFDEIWTVDLHSEQDRKLFPAGSGRRGRTLYLRDARIVHRKGVAQSVVSSREAHFLHGHHPRLREYPRFQDHRAPRRARSAQDIAACRLPRRGGFLDAPDSSLSSHSCSSGSSSGNWHDCAHPLPECRAKTGLANGTNHREPDRCRI